MDQSIKNPDAIDTVPIDGAVKPPLEINVVTNDGDKESFTLPGNDGIFFVDQKTLSDIEKDILDLQKARSIIENKLKNEGNKIPEKEETPSINSSVLTEDIANAIRDTIALELKKLQLDGGEKSAKKKKKKIKIEDGDIYFDASDSERNSPFLVDQQDQEDVKSNATSIFSKSPFERLTGRLQRAIDTGETSTSLYAENKTVLDESKDLLKKAISDTEENSSTMRLALQEEEFLLNLLDKAKEVLLKVNIRLDSNRIESEKRRLAPKSKLPSFNCDPISFRSWISDIDDQLRFFDDNSKISNLKACITGPEKDEVLQLLTNINEYDEVKRVLEDRFGNLSVILPSRREKIRRLKSPRTAREENMNVTEILNFYRLLESHKSTKEFNSEMIYVSTEKLQDYNKNEMRIRPTKHTADFIDRLENIMKTNHEILLLSNNDDKPKNPHVRVNTARVKNNSYKCNICKGNHFTNDCNLLANKNVKDIKAILSSKHLCNVCLLPLDVHPRKYCKEYFSKKFDKMMQNACHRCSSGLQHRVCPCRKRNSGVKTVPLQSSQNLIAADSTSPPPIQSPQNSSSLAGIPTITNNSTQIEHNTFNLNGVPLGNTIFPAQIANIVSSSGSLIQTLLVYDTMSSNTILDSNLIRYMSEFSPCEFKFDTAESSHPISGGIGKIAIQGSSGLITLNGVVKKIRNNMLHPQRIEIPTNWCNTFNVPSAVLSPAGPFTIIIGVDNCELMPDTLATHGKLSILRSKIDGHYMLMGCAPPHSWNNTSTSNMIRCFRSSFLPKNDAKLIELHAPQEFATSADPCQEHKETQKNCKACVCKSERSLQDTFEEEVLYNSLTFHKSESLDTGYYESSIPYNKDIYNLPSYKDEVKRYMKGYQKRLINQPKTAKELDDIITKNISLGTLQWRKEILEENPDFGNYKQSYQPMNHVFKESKSTPTRMVINCSFKTGSLPSFNDCQFKGPSLNRKLFDNLASIRTYKCFAVSDIDKFYNQVKINPKDSNLHTLLYKRHGILCTCGCDFEDICNLSLSFGMKSAQCLANTAKIDASIKFIKPKCEQAHTLVKQSYTDDIFAGAKTTEKLKEHCAIITEGLRKASFTTKEWVFNSEFDDDDLRQNESINTLGLKWFSAKDYWSADPQINLSPKKRGMRSSSHQIDTAEDLETYFSSNKLTKRQMLRAVHSLFDPLCLFVQARSNLFLLYRNLLIENPKLDWEDPISEKIQNQLKKALKMVLEIKNLKLNRCGLPDDFSNGLTIGLFFDGSGDAANARIFLKAKTVSYFCGATRLADLGPQSATKTECRATLLALQLGQFLDDLFKENGIVIKEFFLFGDSDIALSSLCSISAQLKLFYSSRYRVAQEIVKKLNVKIYRVDGTENDADIGSKLSLEKNYALEDWYWTSKWFFKDPSEWPCVRYEFKPAHLSFNIFNPRYLLCNAIGLQPSLLSEVIDKFRSFKKIRLILSYVMYWKTRDFQVALKNAKDTLLILSQPSELQKKRFEKLYDVFDVPIQNGRLTMCKSRPFINNGTAIQQQSYLIDGKSRIGRRIVNDHHIHCASPNKQLLHMIDKGYLVIGARKIFKKIRTDCVTCKKISKAVVVPMMGPSLQQEASKFNVMDHAMFDVAGPITVKVSRNVTKKSYILTLTCIWSRYTLFTIMHDLSANSVLQALKTAAFNLGGTLPKHLYSDHGTNLLPIRSIQNEEQVDLQSNEIREIVATLKKEKIELHLSSPSAPWRQGLVESLHKLLKLTMRRAGIFTKSNTLENWIYILAYCTHVLNSRPLNLRLQDQLETMEVLTPNKLVFGSQIQPPSNTDIDISSVKLYKQLNILDQQLRSWKSIWYESYLQESKRFSKWKHPTSSLDVGDIVYITDHQNVETNFMSFGEIAEKLTPRTFVVKYIKKPAILNENNHIVKTAKTDKITRPAQKLVKLLEKASEREIDIDPFLNGIDYESDNALPSLKVIYDDESETIQDIH